MCARAEQTRVRREPGFSGARAQDCVEFWPREARNYPQNEGRERPPGGLKAGVIGRPGGPALDTWRFTPALFDDRPFPFDFVWQLDFHLTQRQQR